MVYIPLVLLFGLGAWLVERSGRVTVLEEMIFILFGFFLGSTGFAPLIRHEITALFHLFGTGH